MDTRAVENSTLNLSIISKLDANILLDKIKKIEPDTIETFNLLGQKDVIQEEIFEEILNKLKKANHLKKFSLGANLQKDSYGLDGLYLDSSQLCRLFDVLKSCTELESLRLQGNNFNAESIAALGELLQIVPVKRLHLVSNVFLAQESKKLAKIFDGNTQLEILDFSNHPEYFADKTNAKEFFDTIVKTEIKTLKLEANQIPSTSIQDVISAIERKPSINLHLGHEGIANKAMSVFILKFSMLLKKECRIEILNLPASNINNEHLLTLSKAGENDFLTALDLQNNAKISSESIEYLKIIINNNKKLNTLCLDGTSIEAGDIDLLNELLKENGEKAKKIEEERAETEKKAKIEFANQALITGAAENDFHLVEFAISRHVQGVKIYDDQGNTALHLAVKSNNKEITEMLLNAFPDLFFVENKSKKMPINLSSNPEMVSFLYQKYCAVQSIKLDDNDIAGKIFEHASFKISKDLANDLLLIAAKHNNLQLAKTAIKSKADINVQHSVNKETPLYTAVCKGNYTLAIFFIQQRADPYIGDKYEETPYAYLENQMAILKKSLSADKDLPLNTFHVGKMSLSSATTPEQKLVLMSSLLSMMAGQRLLSLIKYGPNQKIKSALTDAIKYAADMTTQCDEQGATILHLIARYGSVETLILLCEKFDNLDINVKDSEGYTPLHRLAERGDVTLLAAFQEKFTNMNLLETDNQGQIALHKSMQAGHKNLSTALMTAHNAVDGQTASYNVKDSEGKIPSDYEAEQKQSNVLVLKLAANASPQTFKLITKNGQDVPLDQLTRHTTTFKTGVNGSPRSPDNNNQSHVLRKK